MYTRILLLKREMENTLKKNFLYNYRKNKFYKKKILPIFNNILENSFMFRYDNIIELYVLVRDVGGCKYFDIVDDDYDYNTIMIELYDVLKIRIDIGISIREIKITIDELSLDYNVSYTFTDKLRFKTYNDETKDKDQELINMCNEILVKGYITLLYRAFFDENIKTEIHSNIKEYCEDSLEDTLGKIDDTKELNELLLQINK